MPELSGCSDHPRYVAPDFRVKLSRKMIIGRLFHAVPYHLDFLRSRVSAHCRRRCGRLSVLGKNVRDINADVPRRQIAVNRPNLETASAIVIFV